MGHAISPLIGLASSSALSVGVRKLIVAVNGRWGVFGLACLGAEAVFEACSKFINPIAQIPLDYIETTCFAHVHSCLEVLRPFLRSRARFAFAFQSPR